MYFSNFYTCKVINDRAYDLQEPSGDICQASVVDIYLLMMAEYIIKILPDAKAFEREHKYISDPPLMTNLQWKNSKHIPWPKPQQNLDN